MAVTKTHPIKSTLKAAIDYICNPEKTDGKLLVSSYGCAAETADIEFDWTRRYAIDKGTNLGHHPIQAFQPGEVTPEQAIDRALETYQKKGYDADWIHQRILSIRVRNELTAERQAQRQGGGRRAARHRSGHRSAGNHSGECR